MEGFSLTVACTFPSQKIILIVNEGLINVALTYSMFGRTASLLWKMFTSSLTGAIGFVCRKLIMQLKMQSFRSGIILFNLQAILRTRGIENGISRIFIDLKIAKTNFFQKCCKLLIIGCLIL